MMEISALKVGSIVKLKKPHPCGGFEWKVTSLGMDCRLQCLKCHHQILLSRNELQKRVKAILS
ncbi:MAG: DUF951 domain-containing protein [Bacillota bacterium]|jgi:hypothetical protein